LPEISKQVQNIYPIFDTLVSTSEKEQLLGQKAIVVWMIGLSGSGKSTLARALENTLHEKGYLTQLLDGDNLRTGINNNLGFSKEERIENIRRAAEVSKLFANCGIITICSLISPTHSIQKMARKIIGEKYTEVYINCPLEICEQRDVKGLYAKARNGEIKDFTGIGSPFEEPIRPDLKLNTGDDILETCHKQLVDFVLSKIEYKK